MIGAAAAEETLGLTFNEERHEYRWNGKIVPSVTQVLFSWSRISKIDPQDLAAAAALGKDVHEATALDDLGILDESTVDDYVAPRLRAWRKFRAEKLFVPYLVEEKVYHPAHRFAGTLDRIGTMRYTGPNAAEETTLVEIKTGAEDPTHALQTAAYWECRGMRRGRRGSVYLLPDGTYRDVWYREHGRDWSLFLAALVNFNWRKTHGL